MVLELLELFLCILCVASEEEEDKSFSSVVCSFLGIGVRSFVEARPPGIASWADDGAQKAPDF